MPSYLNKHVLHNQNVVGKKTSGYKNQGDHLEKQIKTKISETKPSPIYVHQFSKINEKDSISSQNSLKSGIVHKNLYKHEVPNYYKGDLLSNDTINQSIQSKNNQQKSKIPISNSLLDENPLKSKSEMSNKPSVIKKQSQLGKIKKSKLFNPENKAAIDKLEESYWAKWKPNKSYKQKNIQDDCMGKTKSHQKVLKKHVLHNKSDSNETIMSHYQTKKSIQTCTAEDQKAKESHSQKSMSNKNKELPPIILSNVKSLERNKELRPLDMIISTITPHLPAKDSDNEDVNPLKHTDSFILHSRKQTNEKPQHFQQPRCIKLFKNASAGSYVKGGTYTLKSCLKKEKMNSKGNVHLGRPGSPLKITVKNKTNKK